MTSKIKVDNIENQCGGAVVTKCGGTTTISGSIVKSNAIQASDGGNLVSQSGTTITLGASGDTINLAAGASQTGFGRTGTVDWNTTPKTATFTAVSGDGFFANTTGSAFTMNLPAGVAGAIVSVADYAGTWQTNNLTVSPNGTDKIGGVNDDSTLNTEGQSVTFVFVDSTQGWINTMDSTSNVRSSSFICASVSGACNTLTTVCTNFKVAVFTGPGNFTVNSGAGTSAFVDYTVVAGGGGGGGNGRAGGGGGGGFRESKTSPVSGCWSASPLAATSSLPVSVQAYPIVVGGGGAGQPGPAPNSAGSRGGLSSFSTITSTGGGGGRDDDSPLPGNPPSPGGSGGGSGGGANAANIGGVGNTPPVSPAQGTSGGSANSPDGLGNQGAGGGGATQAGFSNNPAPTSGHGGDGATNSITSASVARSGGGGAEGVPGKGPGPGGAGGGGAGGGAGATGTTGTTNLGGGGGGSGGGNAGANGGSGTVIIRYRFQ